MCSTVNKFFCSFESPIFVHLNNLTRRIFSSREEFYLLIGNSRGNQPNAKTETNSAKAMISLESDERLLMKENGET